MRIGSEPAGHGGPPCGTRGPKSQGVHRTGSTPFINRVANQADATVDVLHVEAQLDVLDVQVVGDLATANDAMEDWRDLVPDEVEKLEAIARSRVYRAGGFIRLHTTDQLVEAAEAQLPVEAEQPPHHEPEEEGL